MAFGLPGGHRFWLVLLLVVLLTLDACDAHKRRRRQRKNRRTSSHSHSSSDSSSSSSSSGSSRSYPPPCLDLPPLVADAGEDFEGEICSGDLVFTYQLSGTASSDCNSDLYYEWTMLEGPADPNICNSEDPQTSISLTVEGTYIFQLAVSNECGQEDVDNVTVIVTCTPQSCAAVTGESNCLFCAGATCTECADTYLLTAPNTCTACADIASCTTCDSVDNICVECEPGHTLDNGECIEVDGCVEGACENGATCVSNTYPTPPTCVCPPDYSGTKCEIHIAPGTQTYNCKDNIPCTGNQPFYFAHDDPKFFVQCDAHGGCFKKPCGAGTVWSQSAFTCVHAH